MDLKDRYEAYEKANRITHVAKKGDAKRLGINVGDTYTAFPQPTTKEKAWDKLNNYTSLIHLETLIKIFKRNFPINLRTLKDELAELQKFIDESEKYSTIDAFKGKDEYFKQLHHNYEYLKLKYGYYENAEYHPNFFSAYTGEVYGKYFVYKNWIEEQIESLSPQQKKDNLKEFEVVDHTVEDNTFTIFEIIKRELYSYHWIFISQFEKASTQITTPMIHKDGRYCKFINIHSNRELNRVEKYKSHYVQRFENGKRSSVVENELFDIYEKALKVRDYYNENLSDLNPTVKKIILSFENNFSQVRDKHTMEVAIENYRIQDVDFEPEAMQKIHSNGWFNKEFRYFTTNYELAQKCQDLLSFIENFEIDKIKQIENKSDHKENLEPEIKNLHTHIFKTNAFEIFEIYKENRDITLQSRTDLRLLFDHFKRDNLLNDTIELKHYIRWLNKIYFENELTELRTIKLDSKENIVRSKEYEQIKKATLKKP